MLCLTESGQGCAHDAGDLPVICLRSAAVSGSPEDASVYRYDRAGLLAALLRKVGGARS